jgi:hypothetical protein
VSFVPQVSVLNPRPPHPRRHSLLQHSSHFLGLWRYPHWSLPWRSFSSCCSSSWVLLECVNIVEYAVSAARRLEGNEPVEEA